MEKLPILCNGFFRCHGNVCYIFLIDAILCQVHRICPSNMYINFEKNRLKIDDFHFSLIQRFRNVRIQNSEHFHMTLTVDLYLTLVLSFTFDLDDLTI